MWKLKNEVRVQAQYDDNGQEDDADKPHLVDVPVKDLVDGENNSLVVDGIISIFQEFQRKR